MNQYLRALIAIALFLIAGSQALDARVQIAGPAVILFVALGILIPSATIYYTADPKWLVIAAVISFALLVAARFSAPSELPALLVVPAGAAVLFIIAWFIRQGRYTAPLIDPREKTGGEVEKK